MDYYDELITTIDLINKKQFDAIDFHFLQIILERYRVTILFQINSLIYSLGFLLENYSNSLAESKSILGKEPKETQKETLIQLIDEILEIANKSPSLLPHIKQKLRQENIDLEN